MRQLKITKQITQRNEESINHYFKEISKYEMITAEEEAELSTRIGKGDEIALEKLVVSNLRFVVSVAKQYQNKGLSFPDLINEGNVGLVKAAKKFDATRGFKFISYAVWWIRQSITQAISDQTRIVRLPLNQLSSINKITKAIPYLEQELQREPSDNEIADYLDLSSEEVNHANSIKRTQLSFDKPLTQDGGNDFNLYDVVYTNDFPSPDNGLMDESLTMNVNRALNKLSSREASILTMSFGLFNSPLCTLQDIGIKHNMTSERVRQIRSKALSKLKTIMAGKHAYIESI